MPVFFITVYCAILYYTKKRKLCVSTSGAQAERNTTVGSLLTKGCVTDWLHSATARHEYAAKRNTNGTASSSCPGNCLTSTTNEPPNDFYSYKLFFQCISPKYDQSIVILRIVIRPLSLFCKYNRFLSPLIHFEFIRLNQWAHPIVQYPS